MAPGASSKGSQRFSKPTRKDKEDPVQLTAAKSQSRDFDEAGVEACM